MEILIVDDNKEITDMISFFLDSQDISCKVVNEGKEAINMIKNKKYDIILLDLAMPEFSGLEIFNNLKKDDLLKQNNILLFTAAYLSEEQIQKMITDGAKGILKKPLSIDKIIEAIEKFK